MAVGSITPLFSLFVALSNSSLQTCQAALLNETSAKSLQRATCVLQSQLLLGFVSNPAVLFLMLLSCCCSLLV